MSTISKKILDLIFILFVLSHLSAINWITVPYSVRIAVNSRERIGVKQIYIASGIVLCEMWLDCMFVMIFTDLCAFLNSCFFFSWVNHMTLNTTKWVYHWLEPNKDGKQHCKIIYRSCSIKLRQIIHVNTPIRWSLYWLLVILQSIHHWHKWNTHNYQKRLLCVMHSHVIITIITHCKVVNCTSILLATKYSANIQLNLRTKTRMFAQKWASKLKRNVVFGTKKHTKNKHDKCENL